jgi:uncharacterized protein YjiS (DUF1127 family)
MEQAHDAAAREWLCRTLIWLSPMDGNVERSRTRRQLRRLIDDRLAAGLSPAEVVVDAQQFLARRGSMRSVPPKDAA